MKNVCLTFLFAMFSIVLAKSESIASFPPEDIKVTITIEFGRKPDCAWAFAICGITIGGSGLTANGESFPNGSGGGGGGSWKMTFSRESFAKAYPTLLSNLDGKSSVTFVDSYIVPADVKKALGSVNELIIQANVPYPLKIENGLYVITFPM